MPVAGTGAVIPAIAKLARAFRQRGLAIEQGARIGLPGSPGSQIAAELLPKVVELDHDC
jgi:hypothetical protein